MRDFAGTPGTLTSLILRLFQCTFAACSIASLTNTSAFYNYTAYSYLIGTMGLLAFWSFGLAFLDACALAKKKALHNPSLINLFFVGDWVTATLSLAATSSSAGITILYYNDLGACDVGEVCKRYQLAVILAFVSCVTMGISALITFWLYAAD